MTHRNYNHGRVLRWCVGVRGYHSTIAIWWLLGVSQLVAVWRLWPGRRSPDYRHALCTATSHYSHYSHAATPTDGALLLLSGLWLHTEEAHWAPATGCEACVSAAALELTFHFPRRVSCHQMLGTRAACAVDHTRHHKPLLASLWPHSSAQHC